MFVARAFIPKIIELNCILQTDKGFSKVPDKLNRTATYGLIYGYGYIIHLNIAIRKVINFHSQPQLLYLVNYTALSTR